MAGGLAYSIADNGRSFAVEDHAATPCTARELGEDLPGGRIADAAVNRDRVLLVDFHGSGNAENAIWRYRLDGTLIDKVGLEPEGKSLLGWVDEVATCADGVCALENGKLVIFDHAGKLIAKHAINAGWSNAVDLLEVGGALYLLVKLKDADGKPGADLVRLDGVYAK